MNLIKTFQYITIFMLVILVSSCTQTSINQEGNIKASTNEASIGQGTEVQSENTEVNDSVFDGEQNINETQGNGTSDVEIEKKEIIADKDLLVKKDEDPDSDAIEKKNELSKEEREEIPDFDFCRDDPNNPICGQPVNFPYCADIYGADAKPGFDEIEKMVEWPMYKDFPDDPRVQILNEAAKPDGFEKAKVWARKCAGAIVK